MAVIKFGSVVTGGRGSLGGSTIQPCHSGHIWRNKPTPTKSRTQAQSIIRGYNKTMQAGWRSLSDQDRKVWNNYAQEKPVFNRTGEKHPLSGHSLWLKYQFTYLNAGLPFLTDPAYYNSVPLCPEAKTIYDYMPTKPDSRHLWLLNNFVSRCVDNNVWSGLHDYLQIYASHAADSSFLNWLNPGTFDASLSGALPFEAYKGYTGTGVAWIITNYDPSVDAINYSLDSANFGVHNNTNILTDARALLGGEINVGELLLRTTTFQLWMNSIAYCNVPHNNNVVGTICCTRLNNAFSRFYFNKVMNEYAKASASVPVGVFNILARVNGQLPSLNQVAASWAGGGMSIAQNSIFTDLLQTYLSNI